MSGWREVEAAAPELAAAVRRVFDAHRHKTMATLRRDGSPRISGTEATFVDGDLWVGCMPGSRKADDLLRDPRVAIHSATVDVDLRDGDAKVAGRAVPVDDEGARQALIEAQGHGADEGSPPEAFPLFRIDVTGVALVRIGEPNDHLVVESWTSATGYRRRRR